MKLHHIGVACNDIEEEIVNISKIHEVVHITPVVFDELQNARLVMITLADGTNIELIAGPQVEKMVRKGVTYYHLCFEVNDIEKEISRLLDGENAKLISAPKPAILFNGRLVAFLYVSYGLIELVEAVR